MKADLCTAQHHIGQLERHFVTNCMNHFRFDHRGLITDAILEIRILRKILEDLSIARAIAEHKMLKYVLFEIIAFASQNVVEKTVEAFDVTSINGSNPRGRFGPVTP